MHVFLETFLTCF